jgi:hypothetical protein
VGKLEAVAVFVQGIAIRVRLHVPSDDNDDNDDDNDDEGCKNHGWHSTYESYFWDSECKKRKDRKTKVLTVVHLDRENVK